MEAPHPVPSLRREGPALFGAGAGYSGDFPEDADPAVAPDGKRRHGPADRPPSGAAESRIWINRLGSGSMPSARRSTEMGSAARGNGRRGRERQKMIDHVILTVSDFGRSVAFYAKALKPLGI